MRYILQHEPSGARQVIHRMTQRAGLRASQQAISGEEALQSGMTEKSKAIVKAETDAYESLNPPSQHSSSV